MDVKAWAVIAYEDCHDWAVPVAIFFDEEKATALCKKKNASMTMRDFYVAPVAVCGLPKEFGPRKPSVRILPTRAVKGRKGWLAMLRDKLVGLRVR